MEAISNLLGGSTVPDVLFYVFAALTLLCGVLVVANPFSRNPVTSAMFLVLTIISMAGLFVLLHAFFLAAVQIIVYAGAVIVLFLFVIMLLDLKEEARRKIKLFGMVTGLVSVGAIVVISLKTLKASDPGADSPVPRLEGGTAALGKLLFTQYVLPFEVVSVLLLVAMVGVILLSKKDLK
jgi:NADH-quinone oxidoreductase subunit J